MRKPSIPPGRLSPADWLVILVIFALAALFMGIIAEAGM